MNAKRQAMLDQNYTCAFCHKPFRLGDITCYNKRFSVVVCRPCNFPVAQLGGAIDHYGGAKEYFGLLDGFMPAIKAIEIAPDTAYVDELAASATQAMLETNNNQEQTNENKS